MALELKKPSQLPAAPSVTNSAVIPVDNGVAVQKATPKQIVDAGRPVASEAQAIAGTDNETAMTPLTTKQAMDAGGAGAVALSQAWAESPTSPDGGPDSKSSKTWAGEAAESAAEAEENGRFTPPAAATGVFRPAVQRLRDSVSALDLMSDGGLDEAVRNREVTNVDAPTITAALQEAATVCSAKAWELQVPAGAYLLNARIDVANALVMTGAGPIASHLRWVAGAASEGVRVTIGERMDQTRFTGLALETFSYNTRTAIEVDYSARVDRPGLGQRIGQPLMGYFNDLIIRGATGPATNGWQIGIDAAALVGMSLRDSKIQGIALVPGGMPITEDAVRFRGPGDPIQLYVDGLSVSSYQTGVHAIDAEGVYINKSEFVTVGCGFRSSNPAASGTGYWFTGSHIATVGKAIVIDLNGDGFIKDNLFFGSGPASPLTFIELGNGSSNTDIEGNSFRRAPNEGQVVTSIDIQGGSNNRIGRNYHQIGSGSTAVKIAAGATRTQIARQQFNEEISAPFNDASTSTTYELHPKFKGNLDSISNPADGQVQTHLLGIGTTSFPSDWPSPAGGIVRTISYQTSIAIQEAWQPNSSAVGNNRYQRRMSGGVWNPWVKMAGVAL